MNRADVYNALCTAQREIDTIAVATARDDRPWPAVMVAEHISSVALMLSNLGRKALEIDDDDTRKIRTVTDG